MTAYRTADGTYTVSMLAKPDPDSTCSDCDTWDDMDLGPVIAVVRLDRPASAGEGWYVCRPHLDALREEAEAYATR